MLKIKTLELVSETLYTLDTEDQEKIQGGGHAFRCSSDSASIVRTIRIQCC
jgi:hypothetical protein